ncbi:adenylate/guanylate cyclase domain-containing protein [Sphingosinicellaceae bacterium]|nr:adenylate/guanylate cyclase domain-containing protein [Sphingosinicellaceae bacterium]
MSDLDRARAALARGDLIATYDYARGALADGAAEAPYLIVLSLARMGDIRSAMERYAEYGLDRATDEDTRALGARLAKNVAEALAGDARLAAFASASAAYARIHDENGGVFPAINAASLALLAGDVLGARRRAEALLADDSAVGDFWSGASRAEALLLLRRDADAEREMARALVLPGANLGARATTLRQFELLARDAGLDASRAVRDLLCPPVTVFYCGHMFVAGTEAEDILAARIDAALEEHDIGIGFGALACGTDILFAERLLLRGGELNVVLPFADADFIALSVDPGGPTWRARFDACMAAAASVHIVSEVGDIGDPRALNHGSKISMGLARLRADHLRGKSALLAVWDGAPARWVAGTAVDIECWRKSEGRTIVLTPEGLDRKLATPLAPSEYEGPIRAVMALIFADAPGFSKLHETEIPEFWRDVMGTASRVLDHHGECVRSRNSWGDAIFAVIDGSAVAAEIVLSLQEALARIGERFTLRIGAHYGAVFETDDPVTGNPTYYGVEVSRTARIEPVTPPGQVYVTESFAAALAMDAPGRFPCHYVGKVPLAKAYGTFPMYRLSRA